MVVSIWTFSHLSGSTVLVTHRLLNF